MADDLADIRARLEVCRDEIAGLAVTVRAYVDSAMEFRPNPTPDNHETRLEARLATPVPMAIRSKVGMIANETRAALDDLAGVLAERNDKSGKDAKFPIAADDAAYLRSKAQIKNLSDSDRAKIDALQPCRDKRPLLFALHRLDISRKHGPVVAGYSSVDGYGVEPRGGNNIEIEYLRPVRPTPTLDSEWRTIATLRTRYPLRLNPNRQLVMKDQPVVDGQEVIETLYQFVEEASSVVELFA